MTSVLRELTQNSLQENCFTVKGNKARRSHQTEHSPFSYKMTNKMQLCRVSLLFPCLLVALHVSSDVIAHHQEHLNCSYSFWFYSRLSLIFPSVTRCRRQFLRKMVTFCVETAFYNGLLKERYKGG